jgi:hypothetical protein
MIAFALQAATARAMSTRCDARASDAPDLLRVFHPPGVTRLVRIGEETAMEGRAPSALTSQRGAVDGARSSLLAAIADGAVMLRRFVPARWQRKSTASASGLVTGR